MIFPDCPHAWDNVAEFWPMERDSSDGTSSHRPSHELCRLSLLPSAAGCGGPGWPGMSKATDTLHLAMQQTSQGTRNLTAFCHRGSSMQLLLSLSCLYEYTALEDNFPPSQILSDFFRLDNLAHSIRMLFMLAGTLAETVLSAAFSQFYLKLVGGPSQTQNSATSIRNM
jgi:hypothetical protein